MKALKKALLILGIVVVLILVIGLFLPSKVHVERSIVVKAPVNMAYDQVNTLKNWENWSPWFKLDPKMVLTYSGPASGTGAEYAWQSNDKNVGNGTLTITGGIPDSVVATEMNFMEKGKGTATFTFSRTNDGTKVTWGMNSDMGMNPIAHYFGMMMDKMVGSEFETGLNNMKETVEKMPPTGDLKVEETTTADVHALTMNVKCSMSEISQKFGETYGKIMGAIKKNGLNAMGFPFAIYNSFSRDAVDMDPGIQIDRPGTTDGDIKAVEMKSQHAVKVKYIGPYSKMKAVYDALGNYIKIHDKQVTGPSWEVYVSGPMTEKDSTKLITEVYFPVK